MQCLDIKLFFAFELYKPHRGARGRFGDALGVPIIVLLSFHIRTDIFRRHQADFMSTPDKNPPQVMGTAASFHSDNAGRQFGHELNQGLPPHCSAQHRCSTLVNADDTAAILAYINAQNRNRHGFVLPFTQETDIIRDVFGQAGHPIINNVAL